MRCQFALLGGFFRNLVVGAEPADIAIGFFGGALVAEIDEALEEFFFSFALVFSLFGLGDCGHFRQDSVLTQSLGWRLVELPDL